MEFLARAPATMADLLVGDSLLPLVVARDYLVPPIVYPVPETATIGPSGHNVEFRQASYNLTDIALARGLFALPASDAQVLRISTDHGIAFINYLDSGAHGLFLSDRPVSAPELLTVKGAAFATGDEDNFAVSTSGYLQFPEAGLWRVGVHSDDGFELRVGTGLPIVSSYPQPRGPAATTNWICIPRPGWYPYQMLGYEQSGGAEFELFAIKPNTDTPVLIGLPASGINVVRTLTVTQPTLAIVRNGSTVEVYWPASTTGWVLERSPTLRPEAVSWSSVTAQISGTNWVHTATVGASEANYYRLHSE